jgi:hypothetical protein
MIYRPTEVMKEEERDASRGTKTTVSKLVAIFIGNELGLDCLDCGVRHGLEMRFYDYDRKLLEECMVFGWELT